MNKLFPHKAGSPVAQDAPPDSPEPLDKNRSATSLDPEGWVNAHGDYLYRFALARLRDVTAAEDIVQETFLAALKGLNRFHGLCSEKNWLLNILKNKVADYFRSQSRRLEFGDIERALDADPEFASAGAAREGGRTRRPHPRNWTDCESGFSREEFWETLRTCTDKLPEKTAQIYAMRELDEVSGDEICQRLGISSSNLWVILHRARASLRRCLELHWFGRNVR